ncbi:MAG: glycosyltransferase family 1 protein [Lachnospiraceae bacterium]|nr:glycosyltransferase family 1 protein [Lachnospiraceae bacterium]
MPIRILQVLSSLDRGGAETMIMNYYRNMDREKVQFDFLVHYEKKGVYEDEITQLGGKIYRAFPIRPWNYGKYRRWLKKFFEVHNDYSGVHAHIMENSGFVLYAAYQAGIPVRIAHSHAHPVLDIKKPFRIYGKSVLKKSNNTCNFSCGIDAGKYLFDDRSFYVLPNAIDINMFKFDQSTRKEVRRELGIEDELVIGNVARFHLLKNHLFLVDVFGKLIEEKQKAKLIFVGEGPEQNRVKEKVNSMNLNDRVLFLNVRKDVNRILQAIDIFVLPSKTEGLPLSIIEAQASGLPCLLSDRVSQETAITDLVEFVSLEEGANAWVKTILEISKNERKDVSEEIIKAKYDIYTNALFLQNYYIDNSKANK